jgi:hypothetical protein
VFAWEAIDGIEEVEVVPIPGDAVSAAKVDAAERIYGINRSELRRLRYDHYRMYDLFRQGAQDSGTNMLLRQQFFDMVQSMQEPGSAWAGMIRFFERQRGPLVIQ